jgi:protein-tyrosine phosphatase
MDQVFWLVDGLLAGRPGPVQAAWDPEELRAGGLETIVSLNNEPDPAELKVVGLRHHSLPLPPILPVTAPIQDMILAGLESILDTIHTEVSTGRPTLIHCHAGKDRTGLAMTAYLVRYHDLGIDEAIARVRAVRPNAMSALGYESTARRFAEQEQQRRSTAA